MPAVPAPPPGNEDARLAALRALRMLDSPPEPLYDDLVRLAAQICGTPIALMSLVDERRQWFKARVGLAAVAETPRDMGFCAHAIVAGEPVFVVEDARRDSRFRDNPLVTGAPHMRFYAGAPIVLADGHPMGTVCVIDTEARTLTRDQLDALQALARQAAALLELRASACAAQALAQERARGAELLALVLRGGNLGLWDLHVPSRVYTINDREREMLGYAADEAQPGRLDWQGLIHPDDWPALQAAMAPHLRGETPHYESEHRLRHRDGRWVWVLDHAVVVERDAAGAPVRVVGTHMDISARMANRQALQRATDLLQRVGRLAKVGGWELEIGSGAVSWTDEIYRIHELERDVELASLALLDFYVPTARPVLRAAIDAAIKDATPFDLELALVTAQGNARTVRVQGEALPRDGRPERLFGTLHDITERKHTEAALRLSEQRLSLALASSHAAVFDWDIGADRVHRGANLAVMRGGPAAEVTCSMADVHALIHPDDADAVWTAVRAVLRGESAEYDFEHRVRRFDGDWLWIHAVGRVTERGADGRALRLSGTDEDVTQRKAAELALRDSQRRLRLITDNLPALIAYIDRERRYRFLSGQIHRLFGIDVEATLGLTMAEVRSPTAYAALTPHVEAALRGEPVSFTYADEVCGKPYRFQSNYVPDVDADGTVNGFYAMTFDITELDQTQRQLEELARVDALTGLPNRRQFDERIRETMLRSRRSMRSMALMFLDIDHFKAINDGLGHAAGDAVLREIARRLKACVRGTDVVARYAGDEFVIVLEGIDGVLDLKRVADKIVAAVRPRFEVDGKTLAVTTSAGLAIYRGTDHTAAELIALADGALYQAKRQGRDRFALA